MRTVLLTGGTGAIGSDLARRLLCEEGTNVRLLIRARSPEHLSQRLGELRRFWDLDPGDPSVAARVQALAGDVTQSQLGLDESTWRQLSREVTHVIHSAGNVKLNRSLEEARQSAVDSLRHIVAFVDSCRSYGQFQKLEYVSTVGVGGRMPGVVPERPLVEARTFRNSYEAAKAEAEVFLLREMDRGLSATIHRPGMVVGDARTGKIIQFQVFYHICEFLSGCRTFGIVPSIRNYRLDIIPVDYVARAIQVSSQRPETAGRVFHLCSAEEAPTLEYITERVRAGFASSGRTMPTLRAIPLALMRRLVPAAGWFVGATTRRALGTLPFLFAYLDSPQTFGNANSRAYFSAAGIVLPKADSYLDAVLSYYLAGAPRH